MMPTAKSVHHIMRFSEKNSINFKGSSLGVRVVSGGIPMTPVSTYSAMLYIFIQISPGLYVLT